MASNDAIKEYTGAGDITEFFLRNFMPRYFDSALISTYRAGTFGYINDLIATVTEDSMHAMTIAKREVLPNTAQYLKSLYAHAASRFMDAPMATPATANVVLLIQQSDVLKYGTDDGGIHTFVLDDTFIAKVDDISFMLDYPINIISVRRENGKYAHTTHYDFYISNSLVGSEEKYLPNKTIHYLGTDYLAMSARMRQIDKTYQSQLVTSNSIVSTVIMDFPFSGKLANFEVFYTQDDNSERIQLQKVMQDSSIPHKPFCWYKIVDDATIRITFPANIYFAPRLNSTVSLEIFTTQGAQGNFERYDSDIVSENNSTRYNYNGQVPVFGAVDGPSEGGQDLISKAEFREEVMRRYCTNNTFATVNDLQLFFNTLMVGTTDRFKFTKKRDDSFVRLYGAFLRMKDDASNVVPTNTLDIILDPLEKEKNFDIYSEAVKRFIIKPGALFTYYHDEDHKYVLRRIPGAKIGDDLSKYDLGGNVWSCDHCGYVYDGEQAFEDLNLVYAVDEEGNPLEEPHEWVCPKCGELHENFHKDRFIFTNPYLISVSTDYFIAGYFLNSLQDYHELRYTAVNDLSIVQFIAKHFKIERNAIAGENFYKFSIALSPSVEIPMETTFEKTEEVIVAKHNGYVEKVVYEGEAVYAHIIYTDDPTLKEGEELEATEEVIRVSSGIKFYDQNMMVCPLCGQKYTMEEWAQMEEEGAFVNEEGVNVMCQHCIDTDQRRPVNYTDYKEQYIDYAYEYGFDVQFNVGDRISKNDVIATSKPKDLGRVRLIMDLGNVMNSSAQRYIPLTIEKAVTDDTPYFLFAAYISTNDMIDTKMLISIEEGFAMKDGSSGHNHSLALPISGLSMEMHAFYQYREDDNLEAEVRNPPHKFGPVFKYTSLHTFTNTYALREGDSITLIKALDNAKGFLDVFERPGWVPPNLRPDPEPEPEPEPDDPFAPHPPAEDDEHPEDPRYGYLRTKDHWKFGVIEPDNDRFEERYLTVIGNKADLDKDPDEEKPDVKPYEPPPELPDGTVVTPIQPDDNVPEEEDPSQMPVYGENFMFKLRNCPMVSAGWIKKITNERFFVDRIHKRYADIESVESRLENGFAIDMKFYNTYGKSKFYWIGNKEHMEILDSVNITMQFGVGIIFPASVEAFRDNFKSFMRDRIEATDEMVGNGINLYLLNLVSAAKANFEEIGFLVYYGLNDYDYFAQTLTCMSDDEILKVVPPDSFVPEFLNIVREEVDNVMMPKITLTVEDSNVNPEYRGT